MSTSPDEPRTPHRTVTRSAHRHTARSQVPLDIVHGRGSRGSRRRGRGRAWRKTLLELLLIIGGIVTVLSVLSALAALVWTYAPAPGSPAVLPTATMSAVAQSPDHEVKLPLAAGANNTLTLIVWQPPDTYFSEIAGDAFPADWYGRAACVLSSFNMVGHELYAFEISADFIYRLDGLHLWIPDSPSGDGNSFWRVQAAGPERSMVDPQSGVVTVSAGADITLFNQSGAAVEDHDFSLTLMISPAGDFACGVFSVLAAGGPMPANQPTTITP